jgi:hypothetical protein
MLSNFGGWSSGVLYAKEKRETDEGSGATHQQKQIHSLRELSCATKVANHLLAGMGERDMGYVSCPSQLPTRRRAHNGFRQLIGSAKTDQSQTAAMYRPIPRKAK